MSDVTDPGRKEPFLAEPRIVEKMKKSAGSGQTSSTVSKEDIAQFRNSLKQKVCVNLLRRGYHRSFSELYSVLIGWEEDQDTLDALQLHLSTAEDGQRTGDWAGVGASLMSLAERSWAPEEARLRLHFYQRSLEAARLSCQHPEALVTSCQDPEALVTSCQHPEDLVTSCQHPEALVTSCQHPEALVTSCQHPEALVTSCQHPEALVTSCQHPEALVTSCQHPEALVTGRLAKLYLQLGELEAARLYSERFLLLAQRGPVREQASQLLVQVYMSLAQHPVHLPDTLQLLHNAYDTAAHCGDSSIKGEVAYRLGLAYQRTGDQPSAMKFLAVSMEIFSRLQDTDALGRTYKALSQSEQSITSSVGFLLKNVDVSRVNGNYGNLQDAYMSLGASYCRQEQYSDGKEWYQQGVDQACRLGDQQSVQRSQASVGYAHAHSLIRKYGADVDLATPTSP